MSNKRLQTLSMCAGCCGRSPSRHIVPTLGRAKIPNFNPTADLGTALLKTLGAQSSKHAPI
jgi:hypothetical protein